MFSELVAGMPFSTNICPLPEAVEVAKATCPNMASLALILTSLGLSYAQSFAERCQNFDISIPDVQVNVLEYVPSGTNLTFPYNVLSSSTRCQAFTDDLLRTPHVQHPPNRSTVANSAE